jgi:hypothetical protein
MLHCPLWLHGLQVSFSPLPCHFLQITSSLATPVLRVIGYSYYKRNRKCSNRKWRVWYSHGSVELPNTRHYIECDMNLSGQEWLVYEVWGSDNGADRGYIILWHSLDWYSFACRCGRQGDPRNCFTWHHITQYWNFQNLFVLYTSVTLSNRNWIINPIIRHFINSVIPWGLFLVSEEHCFVWCDFM